MNYAWLLLAPIAAIPLLFASAGKKTVSAIHAATIALLIAALMNPSIPGPAKSGTIIVVADRSASIPGAEKARQENAISRIAEGMRAGDKLGVVSFAKDAAIEQPPQEGSFGGFTVAHNQHSSNISGAIAAALSLVPSDEPARLLLISDGLATGAAPHEGAASDAAVRGIPIDVMQSFRTASDTIAISQIDAPSTVRPGEGFVMTAWVLASEDCDAECSVKSASRAIASGSRPFKKGMNKITFRDIASSPGILNYTVSVSPSVADATPENNEARAIVQVSGKKPILVLSPTPSSKFAQSLRASGLDVANMTPDGIRFSFEALANFDAVVIENVPASAFGSYALGIIAAWVENGGGLLMTGGKRSFGAGGYFGTPLERVLPVSMEIRQEHRKFSVAIVVALDRSGSMMMPVAGGKTKMDLANLGTAQVLDLLSPMDQLGVIAVDTEAHEIVPLSDVERARNHRGGILSIRSEGGGIFIKEALHKALEMLSGAKPRSRHLILFADARDSEEPGDYRALLEMCAKAEITCSVIGLGTEGDVDANLLKDIARLGNGEIYFTEDANEIPRLFAQDTITVSRSTFVEEITPFAIHPTISLIGMPVPEEPFPMLGGYNLAYIRPEAVSVATTEDEYRAPVIACWNAGAGRAMAYTAEADGETTGLMAHWPHIGALYSMMARYAAAQEIPESGALATQRITPAGLEVDIYLDTQPAPAGSPASSSGALLAAPPPTLNVMHAEPGEIEPRVDRVKMSYAAPGHMRATIPIDSDATHIVSVRMPGSGRTVFLPPACLPYSPEFIPRPQSEGGETLRRIARTSGGIARSDAAAIWKTLPRSRGGIPLRPYLVVLAMALVLLDVANRRLGILRGRRREQDAEAAQNAPEAEPAGAGEAGARKKRARAIRRRRKKQGGKSAASGKGGENGGTETPGWPAADDDGGSPSSTLDAIRRAQSRSRNS